MGLMGDRHVLVGEEKERGREKDGGCGPLGARCASKAILVQVGRVCRWRCVCRSGVGVGVGAINSCDVGQAERHVVRPELARSVVSSAWLSFAVDRGPPGGVRG